MTKKKSTPQPTKKKKSSEALRAEALDAYAEAKAAPLGSDERRDALLRYEAARDELHRRRRTNTDE
jgi:hypothetical protein